MFDIDQLIADCLAARAESDALVAVTEVLDRVLSDTNAIVAALPATAPEFTPLHVSEDISIFKVVWGPGMSIAPHDHLMWAVNGIYSGEEENTFYRRADVGVVESGRKLVSAGHTAMLGSDVIHSVTNPNARACTGSLHVYGGDFMHKKRTMWDPETNEPRPTDGQDVRRLFEEVRARHLAKAEAGGGGGCC